MGSLGPFELIIIFLVVLLIFGAKRIPEIARGIGKGIREFKDATSEISRELNVDEHANRRVQPPQQGTPAPHKSASQQPKQETPRPEQADNPGPSQDASQQEASQQ